MGIEPKVGFSKLESNDKDMRIHHDSTNNVLGVSYDDSTRWRKKTMRARTIIAILTIVVTALLILLILTLELQLHCKAKKISPSKNSLKDTVKFLLLSDYHFDYFYDESVDKKPTFCRKLGNYALGSFQGKYGRVGCDSPGILIDSALNAAKQKVDDISFVLMTGDFSAHGMDSSYFSNKTTPAQRTLQNIILSSTKTITAFPNIPVFPMFGNNDLPGHYILPVNDEWYNATLASFAPLILCDGCPDSDSKPTDMETLKSTFLDGGYYSVNVTNTDERMILLVLNSMYWNIKANEAAQGNPVVEKVARKQMAWLEEQLSKARKKGQKVFISSHIPPGIDPFDGSNFWMKNYTEMFVKLVAGEYKDTVAGQFYAHIHKDDFHLQVMETKIDNPNSTLAPTNKSFALLVPSISPVYANNPSFRVGYIDAEKQTLEDYDQFYLNLVMTTEFNELNWLFGYRFSERYPSSNSYIDADRIYELNQGLLSATSDKIWLKYVYARTLFYQPGQYSRFGLYCAMRYVFEGDYKTCIKKYNVTGG